MNEKIIHDSGEKNDFFPLLIVLDTGFGINSRQNYDNEVTFNNEIKETKLLKEKNSGQFQIKLIGYTLNVSPAWESNSHTSKSIQKTDGTPLAVRKYLPNRYNDEFDKYFNEKSEGKPISKNEQNNKMGDNFDDILKGINNGRQESTYERTTDEDKQVYGLNRKLEKYVKINNIILLLRLLLAIYQVN